MASQFSFILVSLFAALFAIWDPVHGETGCPPEEDIEPCKCIDHPAPRLICSDLGSVSVLERVFKNSERYTYQEVHIISASLQFLPHGIFNETKVNELYIKKTTLLQLFDDSPKPNSFYKLQFDDTTLMRHDSVRFLRNVTSLRTVSCNNIRGMSYNFSQNFPSSLKQLSLNGTSIRVIARGTLNELGNLDKFAVQSSKVTKLSRDAFPRPFNVRFLYFDNNNISYIPNDLFTDMPNLQFLTMRNNFISVIPEAAFGDRTSNVPYLRFDGNPLQCNCLLVWIVREKPEVVGGTCSSPSNLRGKDLHSLLPGDFNC